MMGDLQYGDIHILQMCAQVFFSLFLNISGEHSGKSIVCSCIV